MLGHGQAQRSGSRVHAFELLESRTRARRIALITILMHDTLSCVWAVFHVGNYGVTDHYIQQRHTHTHLALAPMEAGQEPGFLVQVYLEDRRKSAGQWKMRQRAEATRQACS